MGSGASVESTTRLSIVDLTAEDCISSLGNAYTGYREKIVDNGFDGKTIKDLDDDGMMDYFTEMGITSKIHQKRILKEFNLLKSCNHIDEQEEEEVVEEGEEVEAEGEQTELEIKDNFECLDHVTRNPRDIMSSIFKLQGVHLDPSDLQPAVDKIAEFVGSDCNCDGEESFDCFINYRVATDKDTAEKVYYMLKSVKPEPVHPFWDKKCLKNGMDWKQGFMSGLKRSRKFVALISVAGLKQICDFTADHTNDNVLLEYETALKLMDELKDTAYFLPVFVGELKKSTLRKFSVYDQLQYPDSITPSRERAPITEGFTKMKGFLTTGLKDMLD